MPAVGGRLHRSTVHNRKSVGVLIVANAGKLSTLELPFIHYTGKAKPAWKTLQFGHRRQCCRRLVLSATY